MTRDELIDELVELVQESQAYADDRYSQELEFRSRAYVLIETYEGEME